MTNINDQKKQKSISKEKQQIANKSDKENQAATAKEGTQNCWRPKLGFAVSLSNVAGKEPAC